MDLVHLGAKYNCVKLSPAYAVTRFVYFMEITLSLPEVLRIGPWKLILIVQSFWCCRVSTLSCFLFLRFGPLLTDLPLEELQQLKGGKKSLHCSSGEESEVSLFFFNNKLVVIDTNNFVMGPLIRYF